MSKWHNQSGRPLSSYEWLKSHHQAKLPERTDFVRRILNNKPETIVDLGCGPGLWLSLFAQHANYNCELIGLDSDRNAIETASIKSKGWGNKPSFIHFDIEGEATTLPKADVYLAFNIFPYINDPITFLKNLRERLNPGGLLVIRQYDGDLLRIGPIDPHTRQEIDTSLRASLLPSTQFRHYDLDRVFSLIRSSKFNNINIEFELFQRTTPFPHEFTSYFEKTLEWTMSYVSEHAQKKLHDWLNEYTLTQNSYFVEVDLVAWVSS